MVYLNKKGQEGHPIGLIIALIIGIIFVATIVIAFTPLKDAIIENLPERTVCMATNTIKRGGGLLSSVPSLCNLDYIEEPVDNEEFSSLLRDTWWMYLQGEGDFGNVQDSVYPVFAFTPEEDIKIVDFFGYSMNHTRGKYTEDISKSDYAYFEKNTKGNTFCFDKSAYDEAINNLYLEKGELYYIIYYDDQLPHDLDNDLILITTNPDFQVSYWKERIITTVAGQFTGGIGSIVVGYYFYTTSDNTDSDCVAYGFGDPNE